MKIGYVRVSSESQNLERQETIMEELGVEKIFTDKQSGKNSSRKGLNEMLAFVRSGDVLIVESYSRLARSVKDLLEICDVLESKGVEFVSKKENIDTSTPTGRFLMVILAGLSAFEREMMLERQAEGIVEAKKRGVYFGRMRVVVDSAKFSNLYVQWKNGEITATAMRKALGMPSSTFYRKVKEHEKTIIENRP